MSKKVDKAPVTDNDEEPEPEIEAESAGIDSSDLPQRAAPQTSRVGGEGGGRRDSGIVARLGVFGRIGQFLHDVRAEMRRVSWPNATLVKNTTLITLVAVVFFAVYLFLVDRVWAFLLTQLNNLLNRLTGA